MLWHYYLMPSLLNWANQFGLSKSISRRMGREEEEMKRISKLHCCLFDRECRELGPRMFRVQWEWGNSGYALALRPKDKFTRWNEHKGKYDSVWLIQNGWRFTGKKSGDDCLAMAPENSSETN